MTDPRFGWRSWKVDHTGSRLMSPIVSKGVQWGRRFIEPICPHPRSSPLSLSPDCSCGIYYCPDAAYTLANFTRHRDGPDVALTFGAGVGDVTPDPVLPHDAVRAARYAIMAIVLPASTRSATGLLKRYSVPITMKPFVSETLSEVERAAHADMRNRTTTDLLSELCAETVMPLDGHLCDLYPDQFGWKTWFLNDDGWLSGPVSRAFLGVPWPGVGACIDADCPHGNTVPSPGCYCGVHYTLGLGQHLLFKDYLAAVASASGNPGMAWASTFGIADGPVAPQIGDNSGVAVRASRYSPLAAAIPATHARLAGLIQTRYGVPVVTGVTAAAHRKIERTVRTALEGFTATEAFTSTIRTERLKGLIHA
ncbi:hypothetical protein ACP6C7_07205 [Mycolicibacterium septicum]|uniref:Uncharacterized protein n=1 Tax=Mycolicibacterium septicum TaxID=98668 RepID=A0ABW9LLN8_9MYCO